MAPPTNFYSDNGLAPNGCQAIIGTEEDKPTNA